MSERIFDAEQMVTSAGPERTRRTITAFEAQQRMNLVEWLGP
jgi:hypothetical protein